MTHTPSQPPDTPSAICKSCGQTFALVTGHKCPGLKPLPQPPDKAGVVEVTQADRDAAGEGLVEMIDHVFAERLPYQAQRLGVDATEEDTPLTFNNRVRAAALKEALATPSPPEGMVMVPRELRELSEKATPKPMRERGERLKLRARHFGDSTEITHEYNADTVAVLDDGCAEHEAMADLIVAAVNFVSTMLTPPSSPKDQKWAYTGSHLDRDSGGNG